MSQFQSFNLDERVLRALDDMGFKEASPIQVAAVPVALEGRDVVGQAQTGTGKTAAFGIPLVQFAIHGGASLVLVPTRELAQQVTAEVQRIGGHAGVKALALYGGAPVGPQARALSRGNHQVLVATPGRLRDHLERRNLDASLLGMIVLDEADEMLNMGFLEEVEEILKALPEDRQTMLFSATMPDAVARLARRYLRNPETVKVKGSNESVATSQTEQFAVEVRPHEKTDVLIRMIAAERPTGTLVFRHTRETVDSLVDELRGRGIAAEALHGGLAQPARDAVLARFRDGRVKVLVATNVAARGLDVDTISHVVNFDAPREAEAYVHRIGRTGRAGRSGRSFLFVTGGDRGRLRWIERTIGARLQWYDVPTDDEVRAAVRGNLVKWAVEQSQETVGLDHFEQAVNEALAEGATLHAIAASALRAAAKHEGFEPPALQARHAAPKRNGRAGGESRGPSGAPRVAVTIPVGRDDGVRPADIVGALTNEGGLVGADVGRIDILPRMSVVEVPTDRVDDLTVALGQSTIRGRPVRLRLADRWEFRSRGGQHPAPRGGPRRFERGQQRYA